MARFNISEEYKDGFVFYIDLSDELKSKLVDAIKNSPIGMRPSSLTAHLLPQLNIEKWKLEEIIYMVFLILRSKEQSDLTDELFLNDVMDLLKEQKINSSSKTKDDLKKLLSLKSPIDYSRKINGLFFDRQNVLVNSRIITDVRPVFNLDQVDDFKSTLVIHNLKIEYHENDEHKYAYFAIDKEELQKL
jgi:hypothetical protein